MAMSVLFSAVSLGTLALMLPKPKPVEDRSTLYVSIDKPLNEWSPYDQDPHWQFLLGTPTLSANSVADAIDQAAADDRILRLVVDLDGSAGSDMGSVVKVRSAIERFRAAGKPATVYASSYDNASYLLASASDEVLMHEMGTFDVGSFSVGTLYMGAAFDKWGVQVATGKAGRFKSAIEPYLLPAMSEEARVATSTFLEERADGFQQIAARPIPTTWDLNTSDADQARTAGLIERTIDASELMHFAFGSPLDEEEPYATLESYFAAKGKPDLCAVARGEGQEDEGHVAVVTIEGAITQGESAKGTVGAVTVTRQLEDAARDEDVRALLVRVNSPGGDAVASEIIRSEIAAFRETGRPVAVSMGSMAASGGYWISTAADRIFLEPTTLTGSIGVFSLRASISPVLAQQGVAYDEVRIGTETRYGGLGQPISDREVAWMQSNVDRVYTSFVRLVADARGLDPQTAPDWAEGRVWGAQSALKIGLADALGTYDDAKAWVAAEADTPASCARYVHPQTRAGSILSQILSARASSAVPFEIPEPIETFTRMTAGEQPRVQAYCPLCEGL